MRYVKWTFLTLVGVIVASFLHYNLPQRDIVRIVNTEVRRVDFGSNSWFWSSSGSGDAVNAANRDVPFIEAVHPNGKVIVYRNEDTGFGWPPYFKFDSSNVQAEARDLVSTKEVPQWVAIRHYGWRNELFSIFPNATSMKPVAGPDVRLIPWFNIVFLLVLVALVWAIWVRIRRFRRRMIDPIVEDAGEAWDRTEDRARGWFGRLRGR
jgi:hypothetical protein